MLSLNTCCFCSSTDTRMVDGSPFCPDHEPGNVTHTRTLTRTQDKCDRCGEFLTPSVTKGSIKCKCDMPKLPRHLRDKVMNDDRPPMQVRYGN